MKSAPEYSAKKNEKARRLPGFFMGDISMLPLHHTSKSTRLCYL
jgi:hypothetical protein